MTKDTITVNPAEHMPTNRVALVGIGKIALDQHVPAIAASAHWELAATLSRSGSVPGLPAYTDLDRLLAERSDISVISLCLPPVPRFAYAQAALRAGRHVMLEKPPCASVAEVRALATLAARQGVTLFATWHSRMARGVEPARHWLAGRKVTGARIIWR
jgi:D-galactose 1-dehydrogenase